MRRKVLIPTTPLASSTTMGEPSPQSHWRVLGAQGLYRQAMPERSTARLDHKRLGDAGLIQQSNHRLFSDLDVLFDDPEREEVCTALGLEKEFFPLNTGRSWGRPHDALHYAHQPLKVQMSDDGRLVDLPWGYDGDGAEIEDDGELEGWLICHPNAGDDMTRDNIVRSMRITIIINLWQRYTDERKSIDWFKRIQAHEGMPVIPDDEADDRAWQMLGQPADPLSFLSLYELQRLFTFTHYANELSNVAGIIAKNDHNRLNLTRVLPMRVVRFGRYPSPFALCQPIGLTDLDTLAMSPYTVRVLVPGIGFGWRHGMFMLTNAAANCLLDGVFEMRRTSDTKQIPITNLNLYTDPSLTPLLSLPSIPPKTGWHEDDYTFSSAYDLTAHLDAQAAAWGVHDALFAMSDEVESGADPEGFIPTWKDRRPLVVVDYAKPRYPHWSDLLKCKACNQRVRVLLPSGNTLSYVQCPSCKDEEGVVTEHLMNDWRPATTALSVNKGQGETMME